MQTRRFLGALLIVAFAWFSVYAADKEKPKPAAKDAKAKDKAIAKDKPEPAAKDKDKPAAKDKDKPAAAKDDKAKDKGTEKDKKPEKDPKPAPKEGMVDLRWKFEKDKTIYQELTTEADQTMTENGKDVKQTQKQTFVFSWTPKEEDKDKNWVIAQKIESVKMAVQVGNQKINYDSANPGASNNPLAAFFKALVGSEFKLTISPDMKIKKVEGREEFIKKLGGANPQMKPLLEQILSDEAISQMADPLLSSLPNKEVAKGATWKSTSKLSLGPIGSYETTNDYTYDGKGKDKDKDLDLISVKTSVKYTPPAQAGGGLPFRLLKDSKLEGKDGKGKVTFDSKEGRIVSSEMSLVLDGKLQVEIGGSQTFVTMKQTQKVTTKTQTKPFDKK